MNILWMLSNPVSIGFDPLDTLRMFKESMIAHGNDPEQFTFSLLKDDHYFVWLALKPAE